MTWPGSFSPVRAVLLLLPLSFVGAFFVWPLLLVLWQSVSGPTLGLSNYIRILNEAPNLAILLRTLLIAASVTLTCLAVAYPLAFFIARQRGVVLQLLIAVLLTPLWTSVVIRSYAWMILFQRNGVVNRALVSTGLVGEPVQILQSLTAVEIAMVHILLPFMVLPLLASMQAVDETLLHAARILGAPPRRLLLRVYLPLTKAGVGNGVTLVFITALGFYITPALLGGGSGMMAAVLIEQQVSTYFNWPLASALATVLMLLTVASYSLYGLLTRTARPGA